MKKIKALAAFLVALTMSVSTVAMSACNQTDTTDNNTDINQPETPSTPSNPTVDVTSVSLNKSSLSLEIGASESLTATVAPDNATTKTVSWTSSDTSVAEVDANGKVTAKKVGNATITAQSGNVTSTCAVSVTVAANSVVVPTGAVRLIVEKTESRITLSADKTSTDITTDDVKVYFANSNGKLEGVEAIDNSKLTFSLFGYDESGKQVSKSMQGIMAGGNYTLNVSGNFVDSDGQTKKMSAGTVDIQVINPIKTNSLTLSSDAVTTQAQSFTDSITSKWKFTVEYANGYKAEKAVDDFTIDTITVGTHSVDVSYTDEDADGKKTTLTTTVEYKITDDTTTAYQSTAVNFNSLTTDKIRGTDGNATVKLAEGIEFVAGGNSVAASSRKPKIESNTTYAGQFNKNFSTYLAFGGSSAGNTYIDADGKEVSSSTEGATSVNNDKYFKITVTGNTKITIYWYNTNTDERTLTLSAGYEASESTKGVFTSEVATDKAVKTDGVHEFVETVEAGTYYLSADKDVRLFYIQLDTATEQTEEVVDKALGGDIATSKITLDTTGANTTFASGDTFSAEGLKVYATEYNTLTLDMNDAKLLTADDYTVSNPDFTTSGEKEITVTYGKETATYKVTLNSNVEGVLGIDATVKKTSDDLTVSAGSRVTIKKSDIKVSVVGSSTTAAYTSYKVEYKTADSAEYTEIDDENGLTFGVGSYTLRVTATYNNTVGDGNTEFVSEVKFTVNEIVTGVPEKVTLNVGNLVSENTLVVQTYSTAGTIAISDNVSIINVGGKSAVAVDSNSKTYTDGDSTITSTHRIKLGKSNSISIKTVACTGYVAKITIGFQSSSGDTAAAGQLLNSEGTVVATKDVAGSKTTGIDVLTYTATSSASETFTFSAASTQGINAYFIIVEYVAA